MKPATPFLARGLLALNLLALGPIPAAAAPAGVPEDGLLSFTVLRDGDPIGTHRLDFQEQPDGTLAVDIETDIQVTVLFVTAYRFEHQGHEKWRDGRLVGLDTTTHDDNFHERSPIPASAI